MFHKWNIFIGIGVKSMISYKPLFDTLRTKGLYINVFRENKLVHPRNISKINKGEPVNLEVITVICLTLQVPIEKVVEIKYNQNNS